MPTKVDLTGRKFYNLTVIREVPSPIGDVLVWWLCRCKCGKETKVPSARLVSSKTKSCGCWRVEINCIKRGNQNPALNQLLVSYKKHGKNKDREFTLTREECECLFQGLCEYCGAPPSNVFRTHKQTPYFYKYNGIDRIDSSKGYVKGNVVSCCRTCNIAKHTMGRVDFLSWVEKVYLHSVGRP